MPESNATDNARAELISVTCSLVWVCRGCRPGIAHGASRLQSMLHCATVEELKLANKLLKQVREDPGAGMVFKPCIPWPSRKGDEVSLCICAVPDASHGNESGFLEEWALRESFRPQSQVDLPGGQGHCRSALSVMLHLIRVGSTAMKAAVGSMIKAQG